MKLSHLVNDETISWLLDKENPSVRLFTLTKLLGRSNDDPEVQEARGDIMKKGLVLSILEHQNAEGFWGNPRRFYHEKYSGTVWQLIILADLAVDNNHKGIKMACDYILENSQDIESFGFSVNRSESKGGGRHSEVIPCLTGNMLWSLIKLGYLDDERVKKGIEWICNYQRHDDGSSQAPDEWPYDKFKSCWGKHSCHMGVVKSLKALAAIPKEKRTLRVEEKIQLLSEHLLIHHIYKKSHDLNSVSKPGWLKLGFPLMYQTDILEILEILVELGYHDPRMEDAVGILGKKQNNEKRWILENTYNGRMIRNIEIKGTSSRWITLKALNVLTKYC